MTAYLPYIAAGLLLLCLFMAWTHYRLSVLNRTRQITGSEQEENLEAESYLDQQLHGLQQLELPILINFIQQRLLEMGFLTGSGDYSIREVPAGLLTNRFPMVVDGALGIAEGEGQPVLLGIQQQAGSSTLGLAGSYSRFGLGYFQQLCEAENTPGVYVFLGDQELPFQWLGSVLLVSGVALLTSPAIAEP